MLFIRTNNKENTNDIRLQNEFVNGIEKMNKIASNLVHGNARAWARKAERKGIISMEDYLKVSQLVDMRNFISHGSAGRVNITQADVDYVNYLANLMGKTSGRFREKSKIILPEGTFRAPFIKAFTLAGISGRKYAFKARIVKEFQRRCFDDYTNFSGYGFTIYMDEAPCKDWTVANNRQYEFHWYGSECVCWNKLIDNFEDANKIMFVWAKRYVRILDALISSKTVNIDSFDRKQRKKFDMPTGTFRLEREMHITKEAFKEIQKTLGTNKPEQGGILGIAEGSDVIDTFVFDRKARVGKCEYNPDTRFLNHVINGDWAEQRIDFCGFVHSHPGRFGRLSDADIEYAYRIMDEFDLAYLYMPVINSKAEGRFRFNAYVVNYNGKVERCRLVVEENVPKASDEELLQVSSEEEEAILKAFEEAPATSEEKTATAKTEDQYSRMEGALPLEYLKECAVVGIGCGGAREFYLDMARMGVKNFVLMDGDEISISNVSTQGAFLDEIGQKKTDVIAARMAQIDPEIKVVSIPQMLEDSLDDVWFEEQVLQPLEGKHILLCGFTDSFMAQARCSLLAEKYGLPYLCAQHHQYGLTSEVIYWYPEVTAATPESILATRYDAYREGYVNKVTSQGSPIFNTQRLNALAEKIAMGMLLYGCGERSIYSEFLFTRPESNLIVLRQSSLFGTDSGFKELFNTDYDYLMDDPIWVACEESEVAAVEDTRKIFLEES